MESKYEDIIETLENIKANRLSPKDHYEALDVLDKAITDLELLVND